MPPNQQNPYDFITQSNTRPSRSPLAVSSKRARIAIVAGGAIILIMIAWIVMSLLSGSDKAQNQRLLEITQAQSELIRVSTLANTGAKSVEGKNLAANTRVSLQTSQGETKKLLAARGINDKGVTKQLGKGKNPKTDAALKEATDNNRFDETFAALLSKQLSDYQTLLKTAYENGTPNEQKTLNKEFGNAALLIEQANVNAKPLQ